VKKRLATSGVALLLIDVVNDLRFEGAEALVVQAEPMATRLAALKRRARHAGIPVIYANDNFGQWRSDFRQTLQHCLSPRAPGRNVSRMLRPSPRDYFVLKPMHSAFFGTSLELLLEALAVRTLILTGIAGNICVWATAQDAYMRGFRLLVPSDCVVSNTAAENRAALRHMATVLKVDIRPSEQLAFGSRGRQPRPSRPFGR
jgi:nicotinamidase-related amidase